MKTVVAALLAAGVLAAAAAVAEAPPASPPEWVAAGRVPAGKSLVVIHNASGRTAFGNTYVVNFDGTKVAKLARGQFTAVVIEPGEHRGWVGSFRKQPFATEADRVTHWVVAYSPAKSWAAPLGGKSFSYGVVPDSTGRAMAREHEWVEPLVPLPAAPPAAVPGPRAKRVLPADLPLASAGPDSFLAEFATTKGTFVMKARRPWSPLGADRLFHLVASGYYDGLVVYRVGETMSVKGGRVVQFGQSGDTVESRAWEKATIADEPVVRARMPGAVGFARGGPDTRTVELAISTNAAAALDTVRYLGVTGFPTVAEVIEGLDVLHRLEGRHGNAPIESDSLSILGGAWLERAFPGLDRIVRARVTKRWAGGAPAP